MCSEGMTVITWNWIDLPCAYWMEIIILHPARERHPLSYSTPFLVTPSKTWLFKKPLLENVLSFDYGQQASFSDCPVSILSTSKFDLVFCDRVRSPIMIRFIQEIHSKKCNWKVSFCFISKYCLHPTRSPLFLRKHWWKHAMISYEMFQTALCCF